MPLSTYVKQYISTDDGAMFRPAPSTSSMPAAGQSAKVSTRHRYTDMSRDQILAEKKSNFGAWAREFHAYLGRHADDAKAKGLA
jgi:negative regulator of sigma E activity